MPAVVRGSWSSLIAVGILVGVIVQTALLARAGIGVGDALLVDLAALLSGLIGAKLWYIALRPRAWRQRIGEGFSIDGSIVAAPVAGAIAMLALNLPVGAFLDGSTPAFFFGMAVGRLGCFLTGCCAGRCTAARWGVWSSDRRVGARRIPAQLLESVIALVIATATLLLAARPAAPVGGAVFVGGVAAYILVRQWLLRLRAEPREPSIAQPLTAGAAALVLAVDAVALVAGVV
jgi:phosphatidylglycerol:prolipoprotein diacylglycerol transferase